ncbi:hypothetical protein B0H13DRAFT_2660682 [Mycena leptocephala]|nr:hypothetical protein B0H13DRAFT_2660682 [Mycena leptocephala]
MSIDLKEDRDKLTTLKSALAKAPKNILEGSILEAAQNDGRVAKIFWDAFVVAGSDTKKGVAKFETCRHCKQGFDITANSHENCVWHYGNLTIDEEVWGEWDTHYGDGPVDSKQNRKHLPQGFYWDSAVLTRNGRVLLDLESERNKARYSHEINDRDIDAPGSPPTKKHKIGASVDTKCRGCGEMYDPRKNSDRVCHWHDFDAVRRFTGEREDWDSDEDQYGEDDDVYDDEGWTIHWTCCAYDKKGGGGCVVTPHLPPRMKGPKVEAIV